MQQQERSLSRLASFDVQVMILRANKRARLPVIGRCWGSLVLHEDCPLQFLEERRHDCCDLSQDVS